MDEFLQLNDKDILREMGKVTATRYDYFAVQAKVNELVSAATSTKSIDELAREVIIDKLENGADRKNRITATGITTPQFRQE